MAQAKDPGPHPQGPAQAHDPKESQAVAEHVQPQPPQRDPKAEAQKQAAQSIGGALMQLDEHIRTSLKLSGGPGTGLFTLLDNLSNQNLGTPRSAFVSPLTNNPGDYYRQQAPLPGVPGSSPPGPLPGAGRGQAPGASSSGPLQP